MPVAGHQEPLAEKLVLQWYTQNLTWSFAEESICGEHKDQEMVLAAMSDEDKAAALAAMSDEDKAAALAAISDEDRAAGERYEKEKPIRMYDTVRKNCRNCQEAYPYHFPSAAYLVGFFMTQVMLL